MHTRFRGPEAGSLARRARGKLRASSEDDDMTYYIMGEVTVRTPAWIRPYVKDINAFIAKHGGRVLARSVNIEAFEGRAALPTNVVLIAFPSREAAVRFFDDPAYRPLRDLRRDGSASAFIGFPAEDLAEG